MIDGLATALRQAQQQATGSTKDEDQPRESHGSDTFPLIDDDEEQEEEYEVNISENQQCMTHPAGYGVVDTGCGRGLIGEETLRRHEERLRQKGLKITHLTNQKQVFRYGNGSVDEAIGRVEKIGRAHV